MGKMVSVVSMASFLIWVRGYVSNFPFFPKLIVTFFVKIFPINCSPLPWFFLLNSSFSLLHKISKFPTWGTGLLKNLPYLPYSPFLILSMIVSIITPLSQFFVPFNLDKSGVLYWIFMLNPSYGKF